MTDAPVLVSRDGAVTTVRLNRPEVRNAVDRRTAEALAEAFADFETDDAAAEDAVLGVFCRRWGVPLVDGGTVRLPRLVGESRAMDLVLTGRPVDAAEALSMGLANRVVGPGHALAAAQALAVQIAGFPQTCLRRDRQSLLEQHGLPEAAALGNELAHGLVSLQADAVEGAARFAGGAGRHGACEADT